MSKALLLIASPRLGNSGNMRLLPRSKVASEVFWSFCYQLLLIHYYLFHKPAANTKVGRRTLEASRRRHSSDSTSREMATGNIVPDIVVTTENIVPGIVVTPETPRHAGDGRTKDLHVSFNSADIVVDTRLNNVFLRQSTFGASLP